VIAAREKGNRAASSRAARVALRARKEGPPLRAQVLNYPSTDWTETVASYPSISENAGNPTLPLSRLRAARRLSLPPALDPRSVSPVKFENLAGLPPALVVTAALDPVADHGRRYVERLREDGTDARLSCYPRATHSFLSTPAWYRRPARTPRDPGLPAQPPAPGSASVTSSAEQDRKVAAPAFRTAVDSPESEPA
jgi:acetyl esterase